MPANPASPFLAERLIARLSQQRRSNLMGRIREQRADADHDLTHGNLPKRVKFRLHDHSRRLSRMLGRLAALT